MNYCYVGKKYVGDSMRESFEPRANHHMKRWLESIILSEKPYLAEGLKLENPDEETLVLLKFCKFFTAVLRDEHPDPLRPTEWSLEFESKYHGMVMTYLNFIYSIYDKDF